MHSAIVAFQRKASDMLGEAMGALYVFVTSVVWFLTFAGCWIYCMAKYGFLFGFGLGWIPAFIAAMLAALFWPIGLFLALALALFLFQQGRL